MSHRRNDQTGWGECARCGVLRPLAQLGLELGLTIRTCLDSAWCEHNRRDRITHGKLAALGRDCTAVPDCPRPRERGETLCAVHKRRLRPPK